MKPTKKCTLVVQSYGKTYEYNRGVFCVLSFFAHNQLPLSEVQAIVFTDGVDYFRSFLTDLPIDYVQLDPNRINEMRGRIDFVHRVKICVIQEAFAKVDTTLFYVDSDTCFVGDWQPVINHVGSDVVYMHKNEYRFEQMLDFSLPAGKPLHDFYQFATSRYFTLADGKQIQIPPQQISWNAGTIVLKQAHEKLLPDVFSLTDQFHDGTKHHGCEQYSFNVVLSRHATIRSAEEVVFHYWPVVQKKIADIFLESRMTARLAKRDLATRLEQVKDWSYALPDFIDNHPIMLRYNAIQHFHENDFNRGYFYAFQAVLKQPWYFQFYRDLAYHTLRNLRVRRGASERNL